MLLTEAYLRCLGHFNYWRVRVSLVFYTDGLTGKFVKSTGCDRSAFTCLTNLRENLKGVGPDEIIYLNFGTTHHKVETDRSLCSF